MGKLKKLKKCSGGSHRVSILCSIVVTYIIFKVVDKTV